MSKKGLGKGLGALFGDAADEMGANDFEYLPLQRIEPNHDQPRTNFDEDGIRELADSIRIHGVFNPILVRIVKDGSYQIIAGERRWRAAREAGLGEIPARVIIADDKKSQLIALIENLQRADLSPIEEAYAYKAMMDKHKMTQEDVALSVSKARPTVANALRLLSLPDEVIKLIVDAKLSAGSARALLSLKNKESMKEAAAMIVRNDLSVREVEALVRKLNKQKTAKQKQSGIEVNYLLDAQKQLTAALGRKVIIKQEKGKGRIELEYYDSEDFDALFDTLLTAEISEVKKND